MDRIVATEVGSAVKEARACGDDRFEQIQNQVRDLKGMLRELNDMSSHKLDELLGTIPCNTTEAGLKEHSEGWLDKIIAEQNVSMSICREIIEKISRI